MVVRFDKTYLKQYNRLPPKVQLQAKQRIQLFISAPNDKRLRNHALKGRYLGYRSIDITGDYRALFYQQCEVVVIFAFIGTHSQLYG